MPLRPAGRVSDSIAIAWLDDLAAKTKYLGLMTADPFAVGNPLTAEPPGGVYARAAVLWNRNGRLIRNRDPLVWSGLLQGIQIVAIAGWTAAFNGTVTFATPFRLDYSQTTSGGLIIPTAAFFTGLDR